MGYTPRIGSTETRHPAPRAPVEAPHLGAPKKRSVGGGGAAECGAGGGGAGCSAGGGSAARAGGGAGSAGGGGGVAGCSAGGGNDDAQEEEEVPERGHGKSSNHWRLGNASAEATHREK